VTENEQQARRAHYTSGGQRLAELPSRVFEFFWRGDALKRRRDEVDRTSERAFLLAQRARATADAADLALSARPQEPLSEAIACELYRQSAFWAACALADGQRHSLGRRYDAAVWALLDETTRCALGGLLEASFVDFVELPADEQNEARVSLQTLARTLLSKFGDLHTVRAIHQQRLRRLLALASALVCAGLVGLGVEQLREDSRELASGKSWHASSNYGGGCQSPQQDCKGNSGYFFHTMPNDENPSIEFDLVTTQPITRVEVENRKDCCFERASPLVVEVSVDHRTWTQAARHDGEFANWRATFPPIPTRWLRLRVLRTTALHLNRVRVFP
jgi:hypothetical protein